MGLPVLRSPPSSCRSGRRCVVRGRKTNSRTKLPDLGIPYLTVHFLQLAGAQLQWVCGQGRLALRCQGGPIRIHVGSKSCRGLCCVPRHVGNVPLGERG